MKKKIIIDLLLSILITAAVYGILTAPHIGYIFFDIGFRYSQGACIACGLISAIIGHIISDKLIL
jgi:hypothetical protein